MAIFEELVELAVDSVVGWAGDGSPITHISLEIALVVQLYSIEVLVLQLLQLVVEDPLLS